jgi:hypothetical protein
MSEKIIKDILKWIIETKNTECLDVDDVDMVYKDYMTEKGDDAYVLLADVTADKQQPCDEKCKWHVGINTMTGLGSSWPCDSCRCDKWEPIDAED